jgi:hypothetical protein
VKKVHRRGFEVVHRPGDLDAVLRLYVAQASSSSRSAPVVDRKARIIAEGKGDMLNAPPLPIANLPLKAQLDNSYGAWRDATYGTTLKNRRRC